MGVQRPDRSAPAAAEGVRPRILVAEDDPASASVLKTLLSLAGYETLLAVDGAATLRMLDEEIVPDLLLLDWMLPGLSGLEVCARVRQRWDRAELPILMVTARTDAESIASAFGAGANDYLTKPFKAHELRARVDSHLHLKQLIEERRRMDEHLMEREKLFSLGVLVSSVAHDLNNPLAGIMGHAQVLIEDERDPEKLSLLDGIVGEVQRCNRIVGDLLAFVRRTPTERQPVALPDVIERTLALREKQLRAAGVTVVKEVDREAPPVNGSAHQLEQVLLNILINAEHALRPGGGTIHVRLQRSPEGEVEMRIGNDGPPIPPEALPKIFDPFFTTKGAEEGTGLGLAICARIVREHRGEIDVRSDPSGTEFRIVLPPAQAPA